MSALEAPTRSAISRMVAATSLTMRAPSAPSFSLALANCTVWPNCAASVGLRHHLLQGLGGVVDGLILPRHNRLGLAGLGLQGVARALGGAGMLADLAQHPAQAAQHRIQPAPQLGQLRTARQAGAHGQVALTFQLAHGRPSAPSW